VSTSTLLIATPTHGRVIVRQPETSPVGLLVGFHGYAETAEIHMSRLEAIPGTDAWTLLSVQALHRFYRGRSEDVVASWMTRQDRDSAIADNIKYVDAAIEGVRPGDSTTPIVHTGFSQGVAMAFRAAVLGRWPCAGVVAVGGDVPPELITDGADVARRSVRFPSVLLLRGSRDEWYTKARFDADVASLQSRSKDVRAIAFEGEHEWTEAASGAAGALLSSLQSA
jgi:predicted esterase